MRVIHTAFNQLKVCRKLGEGTKKIRWSLLRCIIRLLDDCFQGVCFGWSWARAARVFSGRTRRGLVQSPGCILSRKFLSPTHQFWIIDLVSSRKPSKLTSEEQFKVKEIDLHTTPYGVNVPWDTRIRVDCTESMADCWIVSS
jgi:hypothetical protein